MTHVLDIPYLRSRFCYVRETGCLHYVCQPVVTFREKAFNERFGGRRACREAKTAGGRIEIRVTDGRKSFVAARVIWALMTGNDPGQNLIDHADGNPLNNRFDNLRLASWSNNSQNKKMQENNSSGYVGVFTRKSVASARFFEISVKLSSGKRLWKGGFLTARDAAIYRDNLAREHHGKFFKSCVEQHDQLVKQSPLTVSQVRPLE